MKKWFLVELTAFLLVIVAPVIGTVACTRQQLSDEIVRATIKDKVGSDMVILQELPGYAEGMRYYVICRPSGEVALYSVFVSNKTIDIEDQYTISFEKGSKYLKNKPIEEVTCKKLTTTAQVAPATAAP